MDYANTYPKTHSVNPKPYVPFFLLLAGLLGFVTSLTGFKEAWQLAFATKGNEFFLHELLKTCLSNSFVGLLAGTVITSLVQSSSATIALIIATVGSGVISVEQSVYVLMGANIGTTITNTIVGVAYGGNQKNFKKVVPSILVDDFFKVFNVAIFFVIENTTGVLNDLSTSFVDYLERFSAFRWFLGLFPDVIDTVTKPIVEVAVYGIQLLASGNVWPPLMTGITFFVVLLVSLKIMGDALEHVLKEKSEEMIREIFSGHLGSFFIGFIVCWFLQSSSVTVSLIIPLVSQGVVDLPIVYRYSLGAALGTTCDPGQLLSYLKFGPLGLKAGLVHIFLNIFGVILFLFVPGLRSLPPYCATKVSEFITKYKKGPFLLVGYAMIVFILGPLMIILF